MRIRPSLGGTAAARLACLVLLLGVGACAVAPTPTTAFLTGAGLEVTPVAGGASDAAVLATLTFDVNATWPRTPFIVNSPPRLLHGDLDTAAFLEGWASAGAGAGLVAQCGNGSAAWATGSSAAPLRAQAMLQADGRYALLDVLGAAVEGGVATLDVSLARKPLLGPEGACAALASDSPLPFYSDCGSASMAVDYFIPGATLPDAWALVVKIGAGQAGSAEESPAAPAPAPTAPLTAQLCDNATHHLPNLTSYFMTGTGLALEEAGAATPDGKVPVTLTFSIADAAPLSPFVVNTPPSLLHGALDTAEFLAEWADISGNLTGSGQYANPGAALSAQCYGAYARQGMLSPPNAVLALGGTRAVLDILSVELASDETVVMQALVVLRPQLEPESGCHPRQAASASHYHFFDGCPAAGAASLPASSLFNASNPSGAWTLAVKLEGAGIVEDAVAGGGDDSAADSGDDGGGGFTPDADPYEPSGGSSSDDFNPTPDNESAGLNGGSSGYESSGGDADSLIETPTLDPEQKATDTVESCSRRRLAGDGLLIGCEDKAQADAVNKAQEDPVKTETITNKADAGGEDAAKAEGNDQIEVDKAEEVLPKAEVKVEDDAKAKKETMREKRERLKKEQATKADLEERKVKADARVVKAEADIQDITDKRTRAVDRTRFGGQRNFRQWPDYEIKEKYYSMFGKLISDEDLSYFKKLRALPDSDAIAAQLESDDRALWSYDGGAAEAADEELAAAQAESTALGVQIEAADSAIAATKNELKWSTGTKVGITLVVGGIIGVGIACVGGCPGVGGESPSPPV